MTLYSFLRSAVAMREPDLVIGDDPHHPYLLRWYITPWRRWLLHPTTRLQRLAKRLLLLVPNLYLHCFLRDDDDRALHDHPSFGISYLLCGGYIEHTIQAGGVHQREHFEEGDLRYMRAEHAHRLELLPLSPHIYRIGAKTYAITRQPCWTLFMFGPRLREWGFHCPTGWVPWWQFLRADDSTKNGPGCGT